MLLIYFVGGFIPMLFLSIYFVSTTRSVSLDQVAQEAINNIERLEERIQDTLITAVNISDGIYLDDSLKKIVKTQYASAEDVVEDFINFRTFDEYLRLYDEIDSIRIYVENRTLLNDAQIIKSNEKYRSASWYKKAMEKDGKVAFVYRYDEITLDNHISMVRLIKDSQGINVGVLVINISNVTMKKMLGSEPYDIIGVLDKEWVFISSQLDIEGISAQDNSRIKDYLNMREVISDYKTDDGNFKIISRSFPIQSTANSIQLITLIPEKKFLTQANRSIKNSIVIIVLSLILAISLVTILTRKLSVRLEKFRDKMHKVALGDFDVDFDDLVNDEFTLLIHDLRTMSTSLSNLMAEVFHEGQLREQLTIKQKEVEFKMLASQIDPHFLYNTLETIRMEAIINDQDSIAETVKKLAFIMRRKLSVVTNEVSLESELELLKHYLEIQQFRFGDRISFEIRNSSQEKNYKVLPLLLQPIVENAFVHGLEGSVDQGKITITIDDKFNDLEITIEDNGVGISKKKLEEIRRSIAQDDNDENTSIGIKNVYQRIKLFYGFDYSMEITSRETFGTKVSLTLPKRVDES